MQGRNLVVELVAALVKALKRLRKRRARQRLVHFSDIAGSSGDFNLLHHVEQTTCVTISIADDQLACCGIERSFHHAQGQRAINQHVHVVVTQRLQHVNRGA